MRTGGDLYPLPRLIMCVDENDEKRGSHHLQHCNGCLGLRSFDQGLAHDMGRSILLESSDDSTISH